MNTSIAALLHEGGGTGVRGRPRARQAWRYTGQGMLMRGAQRRQAFSLVELVVVIMIIGMLSSMAIPRMSRGAVGAKKASLAGNMNVVRKAILYYSIEHANAFPGATAPLTVAQLTQYSNLAGATSPVGGPAWQYGPYLLSIPPCPIGFHPDNADIMIDSTNSPPKGNAGTVAGWVYNPTTGEFYPNARDTLITALADGGVTVITDTQLATP